MKFKEACIVDTMLNTVRGNGLPYQHESGAGISNGLLYHAGVIFADL
jgi:hypothetical protein